MPAKDLARLQLGYTAAHAAYMSRVQSISDACQRGDRPTDEVLRAEQTAFNDFVNAREAFFDTLLRHGKAPHMPG
jgi:hypothetical protein